MDISFGRNMRKNIDKNISKNLSSKCNRKVLDHLKKSAPVAFKTASKRVVQKNSWNIWWLLIKLQNNQNFTTE